MTENRFLCNCRFQFPANAKTDGIIGDPICDCIATHLKTCGYDADGVAEFIQEKMNERPSGCFYFTVETYRDGRCEVRLPTNAPYSHRPGDLPDPESPDFMECRKWCDFQFISSQDTTKDKCIHLTNGAAWWFYDGYNANILNAAFRMGFRRPTLEDVVTFLECGRHFDYRWSMGFVNGRATGKTTRLVDEYVQKLFNKAGNWVSVSDHFIGPTGTQNILAKLKNRMWNEHHINIDVTMKGGKPQARINPEDINFLG